MEQRARKVLIVGMGAFAQGLASLASRSGATASYDVAMGSRRMLPGRSGLLPGLEDTPVRCLEEALPEADMVILALPASGLPDFVSSYGQQLSGKVVVDVTNPWKSDYAKLGCTAGPDCDVDLENKDVEYKDQLDTTDTSSSWSTKMPPGPPKSTSSSSATWLAGALPSSAAVVKSFSNLSAYTLIHGDPLTEHMKSVAASDSHQAAQAAAELGRAMGLEMRIVASLSYAATLEARQHSLLPAWQWPTWLMATTWLLVHTYSFIRYNYYGNAAWYTVILWITNKSIGWVSLWGMVYTYLPGVLVCWWQLLARRPVVRLPCWLKAWMDARKPLGLLSLFTMLLHLLFSTFLWMPSYYSKLWDKTDVAVVPTINSTGLDAFGLIKGGKVPPGLQVIFADDAYTYSTTNSTTMSTWPVSGPRKQTVAVAALNASHPLEMLTTATNIITLRSKLNWIGESSTLLGIISGVLMGVIALTSMPSITPKMNWREWRLLQSRAGWLAVCTATVHVLLLGAPWWPAAKEDWPAMIPTITLMSTIPPMILLLLKGMLVLPPICIMLSRVRSGKWACRDDAGADPLAHTAVFAIKQH
uniref:Pyrroline-5-carboxylate reductase catalytic N-terminal domain-containing protein n=1 Tax=Tetradesmus obliquus TaxID=3088 RepID=A0A383WAI8_TETOB